jgi:nucleosome binding factor SPN SPT16 subunit
MDPELNKDLKEKKYVSAYQQLLMILNELKTDKISINDAMNKIQLKDDKQNRPYCKVTSNGSLALYGITVQPIVLYVDQWKTLLKITNSNYIDNYIKYNEHRLKIRQPKFKQKINNIESVDIEDLNIKEDFYTD